MYVHLYIILSIAQLMSHKQQYLEQAGVTLADNLTFTPTQYRRCYAPIAIEDRMFKNGKAHYTKWCAIGHQVSAVECNYFFFNYFSQHERTKVTADARHKKNVPLWREFFSNPGVIAALHIINAVAERLNTNFVELHREVKAHVLKNLNGGYLSHNPSAWPGLALHWNQLPTGFHWDDHSLFSGWDVVNPWGLFDDCILVFPDLHIYLRVR